MLSPHPAMPHDRETPDHDDSQRRLGNTQGSVSSPEEAWCWNVWRSLERSRYLCGKHQNSVNILFSISSAIV